MSEQMEPVHVHIASIAGDLPPLAGTAPAPKRRRRRQGTYQTITLSTADAAENLLPASQVRKIAFVVGLDQAIIIGSNQSSVAAGIGTIIPQNVVWPIEDDEPVYVAPSPAVTGTTTARVSVSVTYEDG